MTVFKFLKHHFFAVPASNMSLDEWRTQFLNLFLRYSFFLGLFAALPSMLHAYRIHSISIIVVDLCALLYLGVLLFKTHLSFQFRLVGFMLLTYAMGAFFVYKIGAAGLIYLLALPVLASLFCRLRDILLILLIASLSLFFVGYFLSDQAATGWQIQGLSAWLILTLNFIFISAVLSISCHVILRRLDESLLHQQQVSASLRKGQASLNVANEQLRLTGIALSRLNEMVMLIEAEPDRQDTEHLRVVFVNEAFERCTGYASQQVMGRIPHFLKGPLTQEEELMRIRLALQKTEPMHVELICYTRNGDEFWMEADAVPLARQPGLPLHWVVTGRDITERKKAEEHIHQLAYYDVLTALPNRRLLLDRMSVLHAQACRTGNVSAVLFIDLDHFKYINDARGHLIGDALILQVKERLCKSLRKNDTIARIGGDEFVVLLADLSTDVTNGMHATSHVAEKIRLAMLVF